MTPFEHNEHIIAPNTIPQPGIYRRSKRKKSPRSKALRPCQQIAFAPARGRTASEAESNLEREFNTLARRWHKETRYLSSANKMAMHPAYQGIIALGEAAIPLILLDLQRTRRHWLWALYILSGFQDPAPEGATLDEAIEAWLDWGKKHGHLP